MTLLLNPVFIRMAEVLLSAVAAFVVGVVGIRMLRREIVEGGEMTESARAENALPLHTSEIIGELKQQKFALQSERQTERRRSKASDQITAAMIANLSCGVLLVGPNGLIRQANAAARQILGFASPMGMSVSEVFRNTRAVRDSGEEFAVAGAFATALSKAQASQFEAAYWTPSREERELKFKLIPVGGTCGEMLGLAAVISDESVIAELQQAQILRAETSAEMALELRTSLSSIREWVDRMKAMDDPQRMQEFATDVAAEAERLERVVGGFLAGRAGTGVLQA